MADKEVEGQWPLLVIETIPDEEMAKHDEDWPERVLRAMMDRVYLTAKRLLQKSGRTHELRQLKLYCYNHDTIREKE